MSTVQSAIQKKIEFNRLAVHTHESHSEMNEQLYYCALEMIICLYIDCFTSFEVF